MKGGVNRKKKCPSTYKQISFGRLVSFELDGSMDQRREHGR